MCIPTGNMAPLRAFGMRSFWSRRFAISLPTRNALEVWRDQTSAMASGPIIFSLADIEHAQPRVLFAGLDISSFTGSLIRVGWELAGFSRMDRT